MNLNGGNVMLKPLGNRVLLEVIKEEQKTESGFVLPESAKDKPQTARVVAVGQGRLLDSGQRSEPIVAVDDTVVFEKYAGTEVKDQGKDYLIVNESDIIAIVEG